MPLIDDPLMPRIDQKLVNSPINTPSMAIDGAIDAIDAININSFRRDSDSPAHSSDEIELEGRDSGESESGALRLALQLEVQVPGRDIAALRLPASG